MCDVGGGEGADSSDDDDGVGGNDSCDDSGTSSCGKGGCDCY